MKTERYLLAFSMVALALGGDAWASSVGSSYYRPTKVVQASATMPCTSGTCAPMVACPQCERLGFACVDHASPAPCTAEGCCSPKPNYGYHETRWRRWPGTEDEESSGVLEETEGDSLLAPIDPPTPLEEDQQAPPPIDASTPIQVEQPEASVEQPGAEVTLPPLPQGPGFSRPELPRPELPMPQPPAAAPRGNEPPPIPFGATSPYPATNQQSNAQVEPLPAESIGPKWRLPDLPAPEQETPRSASSRSRDDNPPPLPSGFTFSKPVSNPRRLPVQIDPPRYDSQVQAASATGPITLAPTH